MAEQKIPVFVLNLARATERRLAISRHLTAIGVQFEFIEAVDGKTLSPERVQDLLAPGVQMHPGAIGCYLSHVAIYERMQHEAIPLALILEDDARLDLRFANVLREGCLSDSFDYCFLDSDDHNLQGPVYYDESSKAAIGGAFKAYELSAGPQTLHAYLITREAASKRLVHAYPLRQAIDLYDALPYSIRFRALVNPKGAWVSEHSLASSTSSKMGSLDRLSFSYLRRWPLFYRVRDIVKLKDVRRNREVRRLVASGKLPRGRKWRALPSGREVLLVA